MVYKELLPVSILITFNGEVKIGNTKLYRRDRDKGKALKALQKLTIALIDKLKPINRLIRLLYL